METYRLPKESTKEKEERASAIMDATLRAAEVPLRVCRHVTQTLKLVNEVAKDGNINAASDAGTAAALALAALRGAGANVRINLLEYPGHDESKAWLKALDALEKEAYALDETIRQTLSERASI